MNIINRCYLNQIKNISYIKRFSTKTNQDIMFPTFNGIFTKSISNVLKFEDEAKIIEQHGPQLQKLKSYLSSNDSFSTDPNYWRSAVYYLNRKMQYEFLMIDNNFSRMRIILSNQPNNINSIFQKNIFIGKFISRIINTDKQKFDDILLNISFLEFLYTLQLQNDQSQISNIDELIQSDNYQNLKNKLLETISKYNQFEVLYNNAGISEHDTNVSTSEFLMNNIEIKYSIEFMTSQISSLRNIIKIKEIQNDDNHENLNKVFSMLIEQKINNHLTLKHEELELQYEITKDSNKLNDLNNQLIIKESDISFFKQQHKDLNINQQEFQEDQYEAMESNVQCFTQSKHKLQADLQSKDCNTQIHNIINCNSKQQSQEDYRIDSIEVLYDLIKFGMIKQNQMESDFNIFMKLDDIKDKFIPQIYSSWNLIETKFNKYHEYNLKQKLTVIFIQLIEQSKDEELQLEIEDSNTLINIFVSFLNNDKIYDQLNSIYGTDDYCGKYLNINLLKRFQNNMDGNNKNDFNFIKSSKEEIHPCSEMMEKYLIESNVNFISNVRIDDIEIEIDFVDLNSKILYLSITEYDLENDYYIDLFKNLLKINNQKIVPIQQEQMTDKRFNIHTDYKKFKDGMMSRTSKQTN